MRWHLLSYPAGAALTAADNGFRDFIETSVPPGARFPVKVTVVAWQYGIPGSVQTAAPVEREFYIVRK